ncbi:ROK family transcriptional regulator [Gordonia sp. CPCC 205515]|uniref:ROK family transcriptional regulator n=1 Tax=Gordonia sp. CPCC 205515 TaxID=3140791 RepID=UPI003AF34FAA
MATSSSTSQSSATARLFTAARLIDLVRAQPGITRAAAAQELGISSGAATDLLARLRVAELLDESPAPAQGRGRPTTVLHAHARGPLVIVAELLATGWRVACVGLDGEPQIEAQSPRLRQRPVRVLDDMAVAISEIHAREGRRVRAVSVSVAGTISDDRLVQFSPKGWLDVDLSRLTAQLPDDVHLPVVLGNDATLAGLAEARTGVARDGGTVLHLIVAVGVGGALIVDGVPATGEHGGAGEYGHIPFGDPARQCPCGAYGCWGLTVDGLALAELCGDPAPRNPITYAHKLIAKTAPTLREQAAFDSVAASLGRGVAALVNLHDPALVTLGGLAIPLRARSSESFDAAYQNGLMAYRRPSPTPVLDGIHGDDGPLRGAAIRGIDHITTAEALAEWV